MAILILTPLDLDVRYRGSVAMTKISYQMFEANIRQVIDTLGSARYVSGGFVLKIMPNKTEIIHDPFDADDVISTTDDQPTFIDLWNSSRLDRNLTPRKQNDSQSMA